LSGEYGEGKGRGGSRCVRRPRSKSPGDQIEGVVPSDALPAVAAQRRPALHASVSLVSAVARALLSSSTSALQGTCSHREGVETLLSADTLKRSRAQSAGALCIMDPRLARYIDLSGLLARARACRASIHLSIRRQMGRCIYPSVSLSSFRRGRRALAAVAADKHACPPRQARGLVRARAARGWRCSGRTTSPCGTSS